MAGRPPFACAVDGAFEKSSRGKFTVDFFFSKKGARESGGTLFPARPLACPSSPGGSGAPADAGRREQMGRTSAVAHLAQAGQKTYRLLRLLPSSS